ncbi:MAG: molybdopterin-dependent oxidoreductase [Candidatus Aenigmarchaeota archaeon]|nr:molybdopterin-dependent oxidoreductase [Candidatus Aenigmarchaeota archaeon]
MGVGDKVFKSACGMCHGGCGVLVHTKEGRVISVEGDPDSPLSRGSMCSKGRASIEHLYNECRLKYPLQRTGRRGEGMWERVSWNNALETISKNLKGIRDSFGPHCVAFGQGTGRHHYPFVIEFAHEFGSPNWTEPGLAQCFLPRRLASDLTYGGFVVCDYYGEIFPKCILVWGHNPIISNPDGELGFRFLQALDRGCKVVAIDPRKSESAKTANLWLQLRPGTDCALALAMINTILEEGMYDEAFVKKWTFGFDKLKEHVGDFTPEWAEEITWVNAEKIRAAARMYATTKPACIEWGVAIEQTPNSLQTCRAVSILRAITGNLDVPGGDIFSEVELQGFPFFWDSRKYLVERPLGGYKLLGAAHFPTMLTAIKSGNPYPIKAFLVFGNNTLATYANSKEVYNALMGLDFLVVADLYMTPTAELADIVLPAATWLEVDHVLGVPFGSAKAILAQQKIVEMHECRQDEQILIDLAKLLGLPLGRLSLETIHDHVLSPFCMNFKRLKELGHLSFTSKYRKYEPSGFNTPSGKVELYSSQLKREGFSPLPNYVEPPESPISRPDLMKEYPLILTTGGRILEFFHSEGRQIPSLRKHHPDPVAQVNPETAKKYGVVDGSWIFIETLRGRIKQRARLTEDICPEVVHVEHGWWFPEEKTPSHGIWRSNANVLTNNNPPYDPAIGTYQLRGLLCRIYAV